MSSTSDSEDEMLAKMRESVDTELLNDELYTGKNNTKAVPVPVSAPSLRRIKDEEDDNWLRTSPEFRAHVSKLLMKQMDSTLDKSLSTRKKNPTIDLKPVKNRVKLFRNSKKSINVDVQERTVQKRRCISETDEEIEEKCRLVAVDGLDILAQTETKAWSTRSKATVLKYVKLKDGTLTEKVES